MTQYPLGSSVKLAYVEDPENPSPPSTQTGNESSVPIGWDVKMSSVEAQE